MDIKRVKNKNIVILKLNGRLDKYTSPLLEKEILELIPDLKDRKLAINMENVTYVSSAGLRVLLNAHKELNGNLVVSNIRDEIKEVFEITGFNMVLTVE